MNNRRVFGGFAFQPAGPNKWVASLNGYSIEVRQSGDGSCQTFVTDSTGRTIDSKILPDPMAAAEWVKSWAEQRGLYSSRGRRSSTQRVRGGRMSPRLRRLIEADDAGGHPVSISSLPDNDGGDEMVAPLTICACPQCGRRLQHDDVGTPCSELTCPWCDGNVALVDDEDVALVAAFRASWPDLAVDAGRGRGFAVRDFVKTVLEAK